MSRTVERYERILAPLLLLQPKENMEKITLTWVEMGECAGEFVLPEITIEYVNEPKELTK